MARPALLRAGGGPDAAQVLVHVVDQDPLDRLRGRHGRHAGEHAGAAVELGVAESADEGAGLLPVRLQEASVSAFVTPACALACMALFAWIISIVRPGKGRALATRWTSPPMFACPSATWWATTPTDHFSADVTFFHSASLRLSTTLLNSAHDSSNFLTNCSTRAPMLPPRVRGGRRPRPRPTQRRQSAP